MDQQGLCAGLLLSTGAALAKASPTPASKSQARSDQGSLDATGSFTAQVASNLGFVSVLVNRKDANGNAVACEPEPVARARPRHRGERLPYFYMGAMSP